MKHRRTSAAVLVFFAGSLGFAARAVGADVTVNIVAGMRFDPPVVAISAGDEVTWTNVSAPPHTSVSGKPADPVPGQLWNSPVLSTGQSFSRAFASGETSDFFCSIHSTRMFGRVFVDGTGVQGTMIPANSIVTAQKITFEGWLLNFMGGSQPVNVQIKLVDTGGTPHTVLNRNGTLPPMARLRFPFTITLPGGAPGGSYGIRLELRGAGGVLLSADEDSYDKPALASDAASLPEGFTAEGFEGWGPRQ